MLRVSETLLPASTIAAFSPGGASPLHHSALFDRFGPRRYPLGSPLYLHARDGRVRTHDARALGGLPPFCDVVRGRGLRCMGRFSRLRRRLHGPFPEEAGLGALQAQHPHRPVFGMLLTWVATAFGLHRGPYVALATAFWALLAWQTSRLSRRLLPGEREIAPLAALLAFDADSRVDAVHDGHHGDPGKSSRLLVPCCAADLPSRRSGAGGLENPRLGAPCRCGRHGRRVRDSGGGFLGGTPDRATAIERRAGSLLLGTLAGYLAFRLTADVSVRVRQLPSAQIATFLQNPLRVPLRFLEGMWHHSRRGLGNGGRRNSIRRLGSIDSSRGPGGRLCSGDDHGVGLPPQAAGVPAAFGGREGAASFWRLERGSFLW